MIQLKYTTYNDKSKWIMQDSKTPLLLTHKSENGDLPYCQWNCVAIHGLSCCHSQSIIALVVFKERKRWNAVNSSRGRIHAWISCKQDDWRQWSSQMYLLQQSITQHLVSMSKGGYAWVGTLCYSRLIPWHWSKRLFMLLAIISSDR